MHINTLCDTSTVIEPKYQFLEGSELPILLKDRKRYYKNSLVGYLNINSLKNKTTDLRIILQDLKINYFVLSETKLDKSFPTSQFHLSGYKIRERKDRNKYGSGLIEL